MRCTLECVGVPLGSVVLSAEERTTAPLDTLPAYAHSQVREIARAVGIAFHAIDWVSRLKPDVRARALATAFARAHALQDSLALLDEHWIQIPVVRILVIEFPRDPVPTVVISLRDDPAARGAGRKRPLNADGAADGAYGAASP